MPKLTFKLHSYKPLVRKVLSLLFTIHRVKALHIAGREGAKAQKYEKCSSNKDSSSWHGDELSISHYILSFVSPLRNLSKISFKHFFYYFPRKKKEFKNDGLFLPEKICYRWACHTLFFGLVVDPQTLIVIGHWATHYLLLQLSYVCVCVFNNEKAKNDQKHFLLLCW